MSPDAIREALTFDDVLLVPRHAEVHPADVDVSSQFTRGIRLAMPVVSAAMDTVTEHEMAIAAAREGGIGIIHKNMSVDSQCSQVDRVKRAESAMVMNPVTVGPGDHLREARALMEKYSISGLPVVEEDERVVGIITSRDLEFERELDRPIRQVMTDEELVTVPEGTSLEEAEQVLHRNKIEKLPVVDDEGRLTGLITVKDIKKRRRHPDATKDGHGRLRVGVAVGASREDLGRAREVADAGADVVVIDTAHGHAQSVLEAVERTREALPDVELVAGNVGTEEGARALTERGVDAVKVGVGPGSICTTRVVTGVGVPQVTAIRDAVRGVDGDVPIIADGGVKQTGDLVKALAAGASSCMMGSMLAGTDEAPGETFLLEGRRYKMLRGMGSLSAMEEGSADRYFQERDRDARKLVPEGVEGRVPYKGPVSETLFQLVGGLRSGMGYCGAGDVGELQEEAEFVKITSGGLRESHPHDVHITRESPNYQP